jgi:succinate dehydrogenase/fumarate reductase flavoprotein subunit
MDKKKKKNVPMPLSADQQESGSLGRRGFLKLAAGFGAVAATTTLMGGCAAQDRTSGAGTEAGSGSLASAGTAPVHTAVPYWLGDAPAISDSEISETIETEILVIGGGNSGLPLACTAAEAGAKVAVIEEQGKDTISYYGMSDFATVNSEFMLSQGVPWINPVEFLAEQQKRTMNRSDARLVKQYIDNSGEMLDWLISNLDPAYLEKNQTIAMVDGNEKYFADGQSLGGWKSWIACCRLFNVSGPDGFPILIERAENSGATWYWKHKGVVLIKDDGGAVLGAIVKDPDGKYKKFLASKGTVLAAGDYGGNSEMYVALQNEVREEWQARGLDPTGTTSFWGRDGSGIKMGMWAGGVIEPGPHCKISPSIVFSSDVYASNELKWGASFDMGPDPSLHYEELMDPLGTPWFTVRASTGRRFSDEGFMGMFGIVNRFDHLAADKYYFIWDDKWPDLFSRISVEHFMPTTDPESIARWKARLDGWVEAGPAGEQRVDGGVNTCWAAQSLEELMDYMGITGEARENILDEIKRYNGFCEKGVDEDFAKDPKLLLSIDTPPYYGMYCISEKPMLGSCVLNGLIVDKDQRVLTAQGEVIPGLYATGNCTGGRFSIQYSSPSPGMSLGMAFTLGRLLGKQLVAK